MAFKRYLPRSLFGRALLIVVLPVVLLQAVMAVAFVRRHYDGVSSQMAGSVARELSYALSVVDGARSVPEADARLADIAAILGFRLELIPGARVPRDEIRLFYDVSGGAVAETFKEQIRRPMAMDLVSFDDQIEARIQTDKGVLRALIERRRMIASNPHQLLVMTAVASLALLAVAVLFLRNQVRPIRELAQAADAFGKGRSVAFQPHGAEEVRRAGAAFLNMRGRIERQLESRTRMLSGVSHDLRTPLTRMKLAVAMMEDSPEAEELAHDLREMERMVDAFLAFARGEAGEAAAPADPVALAEEVCGEARRLGAEAHVSAAVETPEAPTAPMRKGAVKRALQNLVENARAHGRRIEVGVRLRRGAVEFLVDDDGPGIPEHQREAALKPFVRLDGARNQDRGGGVGLGLSIAAEVARAHGGGLTLEDSPALGGLRARLRLPR
jgi:two-component system osmolarity sensor histidine kinase EnvZ